MTSDEQGESPVSGPTGASVLLLFCSYSSPSILVLPRLPTLVFLFRLVLFVLTSHCCFGRHLSLLSLNGEENAMNTGLLPPVSAGLCHPLVKQEDEAMQPADDSVSKVFATQE